MNWQGEFDVVVGSGADGLVSAIPAAHNGLNTFIVENGEV